MSQTDGYDYTASDISSALEAVGIGRGDHLFIHSNVAFLGRLKEGEEGGEFYGRFKEGIFNVIGLQGTVAVPTFTYSYCWGQVYDKARTPGTCGLLPELVRADPEAVRSDDANFSVTALGGAADFLTARAPEHSFGPGSFWERFLKIGGKICNINYHAGCTGFHYVEKCMNVAYRYDKSFPGISIIDGREIRGVFTHFVYDKAKPRHGPEFYKFDRRAKELGLVRTASLGRGTVVSISFRDAFDLIRTQLRKEPNFLIVGRGTDDEDERELCSEGHRS